MIPLIFLNYVNFLFGIDSNVFQICYRNHSANFSFPLIIDICTVITAWKLECGLLDIVVTTVLSYPLFSGSVSATFMRSTKDFCKCWEKIRWWCIQIVAVIVIFVSTVVVLMLLIPTWIFIGSCVICCVRLQNYIPILHATFSHPGNSCG